MRQIIEKIRNRENLSFDESKSAFEILMSGKAQDQEIFDFLTSLSDKGETSEEIAGGVYILREKSKRVEINNCIDTCGTGGDGMNTLNISTASALLLASMGVKVAKHGNKAKSLRRVIMKIGNATLMTNLTTASGFATFILTDSKVLKEFGTVASINIMAIFILSLLIIPIVYSFMNLPNKKHLKHLKNNSIKKFVKWMEDKVRYKRINCISR